MSEIDIEKSLIAAMMLNSQAARQAIAVLRAEDFYDQRHQWIFDAVKQCDGEPDELLVAERLRAAGKLGEVGEGYISELITDPFSHHTHRAGQYAQVVAERAERRRLLTACSDVAKAVYDTSTELPAIYGKALNAFSEPARHRKDEDMGDVAVGALMEFDRRIELAGALLGYSCGVNDLDAITAGWQNGQLITIAGRPGTGKSVLLAQSSLRLAQAGKHVRHYTLEMKAREVMLRLAKNYSLVGYKQGHEHELSGENKSNLRSALGYIASLPLKLSETSSLSRIIAECEIARRQGKLDMVVIDYLQIADIDTGETKKGATRDVELSTATRLLKRMAARLDVPVLIGSQLNREADTGRPSLSNLRESGGIEADSNVVIGLWFDDPEMYPNVLTATVMKNRDGAVGEARLFFNKPAHRMADTQKQKVEL